NDGDPGAPTRCSTSGPPAPTPSTTSPTSDKEPFHDHPLRYRTRRGAPARRRAHTLRRLHGRRRRCRPDGGPLPGGNPSGDRVVGRPRRGCGPPDPPARCRTALGVPRGGAARVRPAAATARDRLPAAGLGGAAPDPLRTDPLLP